MAENIHLILLVGSWQVDDFSHDSKAIRELASTHLNNVFEGHEIGTANINANLVGTDIPVRAVIVRMADDDIVPVVPAAPAAVVTDGADTGSVGGLTKEWCTKIYESFSFEDTRQLLIRHQVQCLPQLLISRDAAATDIIHSCELPAPAIEALNTTIDEAAVVEASVRSAMKAYEEFNLQAAACHFNHVLRLDPKHRQALFNFASILHMAGCPTLSIPLVKQLLQLEPDDVTAHAFLWALASSDDCTVAATAAYAELASGGDPRAVTKLACLTGTGSAAAKGDPHYAAQIYDDMAEKFESKLVDHLGYRGPWLLYDMLLQSLSADANASNEARSDAADAADAAVATATVDDAACAESAAVRRNWRMLDLGCGSGLCGRVFSPLVRGSLRATNGAAEAPAPAPRNSAAVVQLDKLQVTIAGVLSDSADSSSRACGLVIGVDVSEKMTHIAGREGGYDFVTCSDLNDALDALAAACTAAGAEGFDIVCAADTFIYLGSLGDTFKRVSTALRTGGYFLFSTEDLDASPMRMKQQKQLTSSASSAHHDAHHQSPAVATTAHDEGEGDGSDIRGAVPGWGAQLLSSARFAHSDEYIQRLAAKHGFTVRSHRTTTLRTEHTTPLPGNLYLLTKN